MTVQIQLTSWVVLCY